MSYLRRTEARGEMYGGRPSEWCPRLGSASAWPGFGRGTKDRLDRALDVVAGGGPARDRDAHRAHAVPGRTAQPTGAIVLNRVDHRARIGIVVASVVEEPHEYLVEHDVVEHLACTGLLRALRRIDARGHSSARPVRRCRNGRASGSPRTPGSRVRDARTPDSNPVDREGRRERRGPGSPRERSSRLGGRPGRHRTRSRSRRER